MRNFTFLICFLLLTAFGGSKPKFTPTPSPTAVPTVTVTPSPAQGSGTVQFVPVDYYTTPAEREIIIRAGKKAQEVIHSQCATDFMKSRKLIQTNGKTPEETIKYLQSLSGTVPVRMYYRCMAFKFPTCMTPTSAVAAREGNYIKLNQAAFTPKDKICQTWVPTLMHEGWGHLLGGFDHDFNWNAQRDFSVPYSLGGSSTLNRDVAQACCTE